MNQTLLYKEWLKLRWCFLAGLAIHGAAGIALLFAVREKMRTEHAEMLWYQALSLDAVFYADIRYLPLVTGLVLALVQTLPEISGRRLRLSLHLPVARQRLVLLMLLAGGCLYLVLAAIDLIFVQLISAISYPGEVIALVLPTTLPWLLAGLLGYLAVVTVLFEPATLPRVFWAAVMAALCVTLCQDRGAGWFAPLLPFFIGLVPLAALPTFAAARRFQQRGR
jgi:hypothetical protein